MNHYQQTYSLCKYCLKKFPSDALEHHMHNDCAQYRLPMESIPTPWIHSQDNNINYHQTQYGVSLSTGSNFDEPQNENDTYSQDNIMDCQQPSCSGVLSTKPTSEEPQNENETYQQENIIDCQQTSCSGDLGSEPNCEGAQDENDDNNRTSRDGSLTELNCAEPQDEMDGNYVCNDCPTCNRCKLNNRYGSKSCLIWHIQTSHLAHYQRLYSCDEHQLLFINRKTLREHMETDHRRQRDNVDQNPPAQTSNSAAHDETPREGFQCNLCGTMLKDRDGLKSHHRHIHGPIKYICGLCGQTFKGTFNLNDHLNRVHSKKKNFTCTVENCSKSFKTKSILSRHNKIAHQPRNHKCNECKADFALRGQLTYHKKEIHGPKTLPCDACSKLFTTKNLLTIHRNELHGPKEHECDVCGNKFTSRRRMQRHRSESHGKKKHECVVCGSKYATSSTMKRHQLTNHQVRIAAIA